MMGNPDRRRLRIAEPPVSPLLEQLRAQNARDHWRRHFRRRVVAAIIVGLVMAPAFAVILFGWEPFK